MIRCINYLLYSNKLEENLNSYEEEINNEIKQLQISNRANEEEIRKDIMQLQTSNQVLEQDIKKDRKHSEISKQVFDEEINNSKKQLENLKKVTDEFKLFKNDYNEKLTLYENNFKGLNVSINDFTINVD